MAPKLETITTDCTLDCNQTVPQNTNVFEVKLFLKVLFKKILIKNAHVFGNFCALEYGGATSFAPKKR
jgi:hypothetical protein